MGYASNGSAAAEKPLKFLIYGRTGWIGGLLGRLCEAKGLDYTYANGRLEDRAQIEADIAAAQPTHVFNAAGVTGRPNVDWCETHKVETIRTNVVGTLTLVDVCREKGILVVNYATGCIFEYDDGHLLGSGVGFKEEDTPNFVGSFYSKTKAMVSHFPFSPVLSRFESDFHRRRFISVENFEPKIFFVWLVKFDGSLSILFPVLVSEFSSP